MFRCFPQYSKKKKQTSSYVRSSVLTSAWNKLVLSGQIFVKFDIAEFKENS